MFFSMPRVKLVKIGVKNIERIRQTSNVFHVIQSKLELLNKLVGIQSAVSIRLKNSISFFSLFFLTFLS